MAEQLPEEALRRAGVSVLLQEHFQRGAGDFQVSAWASHPIAPSADDEDNNPRRDVPEIHREVLFWIRYNIEIGIGTLTPYVQNHYNPNAGELFNFEDDGTGAHIVQAQLMFVGNPRFPIDLMVGRTIYNDPGESLYLEGGYRFAVSGLAMRASAGGTPAESPFNGTDEAAITNVGISAARPGPITPRSRSRLRSSSW